MRRIYVGMEDGLAVLTRSGDGAATPWRLETRLEGRQAQCVAVDPSHPASVYCGTFDAGLWRSEDGGETWHPAGPGIAHQAVMAVAVSPLERNGLGVVYAGTEPSALFRSDDGGQTWQERAALRHLPSAPTWSFPPRPYTHHVRWIQPDPVVAGRLFVAIEQGGVMRSLDGGETFEDRKPGGPRDAHTLAMHRQAPGRLYAPAADGMGLPERAMTTSRDGGASWDGDGAGIGHGYGWSVAIAPGQPEHVVYSGAHSPRQAHSLEGAESTLYYRHGDGDTWHQALDGLPPPRGTLRYVLAADAADAGAVYAACNHGVYRSPNGGRTWEALDVPWPERYRRQAVQGLAVVSA
ncbi:MAG TPA: glycosyl hydrolase [Chloroflexota bacterium]|jgi:photosystem II stability/assembly factor-like uncharacterized protein|nr:glycosyl hydrolase [Chloroflexota bacterium]